MADVARRATNDLDEPVAPRRLHDAAAARDLGRLEERDSAPAQPHRVHAVRDAHLVPHARRRTCVAHQESSLAPPRPRNRRARRRARAVRDIIQVVKTSCKGEEAHRLDRADAHRRRDDLADVRDDRDAAQHRVGPRALPRILAAAGRLQLLFVVKRPDPDATRHC